MILSTQDGLPVTLTNPLPITLATVLSAANDSVAVQPRSRIQLYNASAPTVDFGTALTAADYDIRDNNMHFYRFYHAEAGWQRGVITLKSTLNQPLYVNIYLLDPDGVTVSGYGILCSFAGALAATTGRAYLGPAAAAAGSANYYAVPALATPLPRFALTVQPVSAPTSGTLSFQLSQVSL